MRRLGGPMSLDSTPSPLGLDGSTVHALRAMLGRSAANGSHDAQLQDLLVRHGDRSAHERNPRRAVVDHVEGHLVCASRRHRADCIRRRQRAAGGSHQPLHPRVLRVVTRVTLPLPIEPVLPAIRAALASSRSLVLHAPPGAGKTTLVPTALLGADWLGDHSVVLLEPRRLATRAAAQRMADSARRARRGVDRLSHARRVSRWTEYACRSGDGRRPHSTHPS